MPKITVLLVEDDAGAAETCRATINGKLPDVEVEVEPNFGKALDRVKTVLPDILVLDLYEHPEDDPPGQPIWGQVWVNKFCPIIFHTGHELPDDPQVPNDHPFIRSVTKGAGSDDTVAEFVKSYLPHVTALQHVHDEIDVALQSVLKDVSRHIWDAEAVPEKNSEILTRTARRRVAAMMDLKTLMTGRLMENWEQYLVPPLSEQLLLADLVRLRNGDPKEPTSYRLVLTASCDMGVGTGKITNVLVAKCTGIDRFCRGAMIDPNTADRRKKDKLSSALAQDQCGGFIPLPEYPNVLPLMAANLRDLELIPIGDIATAETVGQNYVRVAAIDSPFRERVGWAYVQIGGRPGVPDCDPTPFIDAIVRATPSEH